MPKAPLLLPQTKWCMSNLIHMPLHSPRRPTFILTLPPPILSSKLTVIYPAVHQLQQLNIIPRQTHPTALYREGMASNVRCRLDQWILQVRRRLQLPIVLVRGCMLQRCVPRTGQWSVFQFITQSTHGQSNRLGRGCVLSRLLHQVDRCDVY